MRVGGKVRIMLNPPPYVRKVVSPFKSCLDGASREELTYAI